MTHDSDFVLTPDNLKLDLRKVSGGPKTPVLCLHGLTRNASDFSDFAPLAATTGRDVYALTFRGRGRSDYDPTYLNYTPVKYVGDVIAALDQLQIERAIFVGTSLGGIVTMLTAAVAPSRLAGAIINDVGPEFAPEGIARIAGYVGARAAAGATGPVDLGAAIAQIREINEVAFPGRDMDFWRRFAERTFEEAPGGGLRLAYDPNIGRALLEAGPAPDLWPIFTALAPIRTLILRGALSDLLTPPIIEKMRAALPGADYLEVTNVGHAPTLTEPDAWAVIRNFLAGID